MVSRPPWTYSGSDDWSCRVFCSTLVLRPRSRKVFSAGQRAIRQFRLSWLWRHDRLASVPCVQPTHILVGAACCHGSAWRSRIRCPTSSFAGGAWFTPRCAGDWCTNVHADSLSRWLTDIGDKACHRVDAGLGGTCCGVLGDVDTAKGRSACRGRDKGKSSALGCGNHCAEGSDSRIMAISSIIACGLRCPHSKPTVPVRRFDWRGAHRRCG